MTEQE